MTVKQILDIAAAEVGTKEVPAGSNNVKYNTWFYGKEVKGSAYPWCMAFVQWVFYKARQPLPYKTASCNELTAYYMARGKWVTHNYKPGDILMFDFNGTGITHVGICKSADNKNVMSYEGNTSLTNQDNGGCVMLRTRPISKVAGAIRLDYESESDYMTKNEILKELNDQYITTFDELPKWARKDIRELLDNGIINGGTDSATDQDDINMFLSDIKAIVVMKRLIDSK